MVNPSCLSKEQCYLKHTFITKVDMPNVGIGFVYGNDQKKQFYPIVKQDYAGNAVHSTFTTLED